MHGATPSVKQDMGLVTRTAKAMAKGGKSRGRSAKKDRKQREENFEEGRKQKAEQNELRRETYEQGNRKTNRTNRKTQRVDNRGDLVIQSRRQKQINTIRSENAKKQRATNAYSRTEAKQTNKSRKTNFKIPKEAALAVGLAAAAPRVAANLAEGVAAFPGINDGPLSTSVTYSPSNDRSLGNLSLNFSTQEGNTPIVIQQQGGYSFGYDLSA